MEWWDEEPATTGSEVRRRHADNRVSWDQAAEVYSREVDETIDLIASGGSSVHPIERELLGDLGSWCRRAIHLQCASGRDTLSLLNEGAGEVVGIDISEVHIRNAGRASDALGSAARWYACDVLDAPHELDGTADLVYTGRGAIGWVHDLEAWAAVVVRLLRSGGRLCLFDDHPTSFLFDPDEDRLRYNGLSYFGTAASGTGWQDSYIRDLTTPRPELGVWHDRLWTFADIFAAVRGAGLVIEHLGEHPEPYWDAFPEVDADELGRIPQTFSLLATRG